MVIMVWFMVLLHNNENFTKATKTIIVYSHKNTTQHTQIADEHKDIVIVCASLYIKIYKYNTNTITKTNTNTSTNTIKQ